MAKEALGRSSAMGNLATWLDALSLQSGTVGKAEVVSGRFGSGHRARILANCGRTLGRSMLIRR